MLENELDNKIDKRALDVVKKFLSNNGFTARKLTDTPTDALSTVNRKYVTLNGATADRPVTSIIGQRYFDTDLNQPVWVGNDYAWVDADGNPA